MANGFDTKVTLGQPPGSNGSWNDVGAFINSGLQAAIHKGLDIVAAQKETFAKLAESFSEHLDSHSIGKLNSLGEGIGLGQSPNTIQSSVNPQQVAAAPQASPNIDVRNLG